MVTRTSTRWFRHWDSVRKPRAVPFIEQSGKFSTATLLTWDCYPEQLIASTTSTVYTRLLKTWRKRKEKFRDIKGDDRNLLLQVAAFYVVSHSDYFFDRAQAVLHRPATLKKLLSSFVRRLDDKFWFVYRQVCNQTYWLTFRSLGMRDKSSKLLLKGFMSADSKSFRNSMVKSAFETASRPNTWIKFRKTPYVKGSNFRDLVRKDPILALFENLSEPESDLDW